MNKRKECGTQDEMEGSGGCQEKRERKEAPEIPGRETSLVLFGQAPSLIPKKPIPEGESSLVLFGGQTPNLIPMKPIPEGESSLVLFGQAPNLIPKKPISEDESRLVLFGGQAPNLIPKKPKAKLFPAFNVRDVGKLDEIAAAVRDRTSEEVSVRDERFLTIRPGSAEQETAIREALACLGVEYERSAAPTSNFLISGLLPTARPDAVAAELTSSGIGGVGEVSQIRNGNSLLPLYSVSAPMSEARSLLRVARLCGRQVLVQNFGLGKRQRLRKREQKNLERARIFSAKCLCESYLNRPGGARFKKAKKKKQASSQLAPTESVRPGPRGPRPTVDSSTLSVRPGPRGPRSTVDSSTLSVLRALRDQVQTLAQLPEQVRRLFQGNSLDDAPDKMALLKRVKPLLQGKKTRNAPCQEDMLSELLGALNL